MSKDARKKSRNRGEKRGFRREAGPTPRRKVRVKRDRYVDVADQLPWSWHAVFNH